MNQVEFVLKAEIDRTDRACVAAYKLYAYYEEEANKLKELEPEFDDIPSWDSICYRRDQYGEEVRRLTTMTTALRQSLELVSRATKSQHEAVENEEVDEAVRTMRLRIRLSKAK